VVAVANLKAVHILCWGLGSAVLMVIGAFRPWAKVLGLVSISGTDDGGDGWIVSRPPSGAIALLLWQTQSRRWLIAATVAGGAGLATTVYDRIDIEGTEGIDLGRFVDPGWGLYVAMIGSASLAAAAGRLVAHV
jgi:hypothetical protein